MDYRRIHYWRAAALFLGSIFLFYYFSHIGASSSKRRRCLQIHQRRRAGATVVELLDEGYSIDELLTAGVLTNKDLQLSPSSPPLKEVKSDEASSRAVSPFSTSSVIGAAAHVFKVAKCAARATSSSLLSRVHDQSSPRSQYSGSSGYDSTAPSQVSFYAAQYDGVDRRLNTPKRMSVRLKSSFATRIRAESDEARSSPSCSRTRTPVGTFRMQVGLLSVAISRGYTEESASYRFPLEVLRFLHEDGSRISFMAEDCAAVGSNGEWTTLQYVQRSIERARVASEGAKTYFKVKLLTAANRIATTVMESYANFHVGPIPVMIASFFLVHQGIAYTIQLQTNGNCYEARLADLLHSVQTARLAHDGESISARCCPHYRGKTVFTVLCCNAVHAYCIEVPIDCHVTEPPWVSGQRSVRKLLITPRLSTSWKGEVTIVEVGLDGAREKEAHEEAETAKLISQQMLLSDVHHTITLSIFATISSDCQELSVITFPVITARSSSDADTQLPLYRYTSANLTLPLPLPSYFQTTVCEQANEESISLFITAIKTGDTFEAELHFTMYANEEEYQRFIAYTKSLFLTPSHPIYTVNSGSQESFSVEGLAISPHETTLRIDGVRLGSNRWMMVRWLYADSSIFSRELQQYCECLVGNVTLCD